MAVYDDEKEKTFYKQDGSHDDLGVHPERREAEIEQLEKQLEADAASEPKPKTPEELKEAEESAGEDDDHQIPFKKDDKRPFRQQVRSTLTRRRIIGGVLIGGILGGGFGLFVIFAPLARLESYLSRINQRAFAVAASAVESRMQYLFDRYMISHILNMRDCRAVNSFECRADYSNKGMAATLFTQWQDARAEAKIFDQMGFSIESTNNPDRQAGVHKFTLRDRRGAKITFSGVEDWDRFKAGQSTQGSREIGREIRHAMKEKFRWYQVLQRRSIRKYLNRKHGIRLWCFFLCKTRDNIELRSADAKARYKYRFIERFVYPFSGKYGFLLDCLISGEPGVGRCSSDSLRERGLDRDRVPDDVASDIIRRLDAPDAPNSLLGYVLETLLAKVLSQQAARTVVRSIPVVGWAIFGLQIVDMLDRMDSFIDNNGLSKMAAGINASQYVEVYSGYRSINDELKKGELGLDEIGAVAQDFDGAEESLVFQSYTDPRGVDREFTYNNDEPYKCNNGQPINVAAGELVCNEKKVSRTYAIEEWRDNAFVDGIIGILNNYGNCIVTEILGRCPQGEPRDYIRPILGGIEWLSDAVFGGLFRTLLSGIRHLPLVGGIINWVEEKGQELVQAFFAKIFPLPCQVDDPGRVKYDCLEAGADVAASEYGKGGYTDTGEMYGIGAPQISDEAAVPIFSDHLAQQRFEYENSSLANRITNVEYPGSLASRFLAIAPSNVNELPGSIFSTFSEGLGQIFTSIFSHAGAQALPNQLAANAFGVSRYGYSAGHPAFTTPPEQLTPEYCEQKRTEREASMTENPVTGFDEYTVPDPCQLEDAVIESGGLYFTDD